MDVVDFPPKRIGPFVSECPSAGFYRTDGAVVLAAPDKPRPDGAKLARASLEHDPTGLNRLRYVVARRSARRAAKSDAGPSAERRNDAGARHDATRRAGAVRG